MPLIDGTYEILEQRPTGDGRTLVRATDPDGKPVRIVWYDVAAEAEASFERYRRTLRRLGREDDVLLRDVVSRPGARYAVWEESAESPPVPVDAAWRRRLEAVDLDVAQADLRRRGRDVVLAGLDWNDHPDEAIGTNGDGEPAASDGRTGSDDRTTVLARLPQLGTAGRAWMATAILLLTSIALLMTGWTSYANDDDVEVPDVVGRAAAEAIDDLDRSGFAVEVRAVRGDGTPFTVVRVDPSAGTSLRPGRTVRIDYLQTNDGSAEREVPALAGRTLDEASSLLREADLALGTVARVAAATPAGTVLAQRPQPQARLRSGTPVDVLVSDGPSPRTTFLPDVVGLALDEARERVRLAGLPADRILVDTVQATDVPIGDVVAMTPAAWHPLNLDQVTVRLLVSDPDGSVALGSESGEGAPDLVGLDAVRAREAIAAAGLDLEERRISQGSLPDGVVLQAPEPGAPLSGTVRIVVNARPMRLPVPTPEARIQAPRLRWVPYRFLVEPGIPEQRAELRATTAEGDTFVVLARSVVGGDELAGVWGTVAPGPVLFELFLNDVPYAEARVTREVETP